MAGAKLSTTGAKRSPADAISGCLEANRKFAHDMRKGYDFASMKGGVRGKYVARYRAGTNLVLLDPEVAKAFPTSEYVNQTLRAVLEMTKIVRSPGRRRSGR